MTLLLGCLVGWLCVLLVVRWAEQGVEEATELARLDARQAVREAEWDRLHAAFGAACTAMLTERLGDADDPGIVAEGLGLAPRYREKPVPLTSFAPADRALLEEAQRQVDG